MLLICSIFGGEDHELTRRLSPISCALGWFSRLCTCFMFQLCVDGQFLWLCACLWLCSSLLSLLLPSSMVWIKKCGFYKYSGLYYCFHWFISMTVPGGGRSQYRHALLESGIAPSRYWQILTRDSQGNLLVNYIVHLICPTRSLMSDSLFDLTWTDKCPAQSYLQACK